MLINCKPNANEKKINTFFLNQNSGDSLMAKNKGGSDFALSTN